jgi:tRNA(fMet)-specific endonuclease VapC
VTEPRFLLDSNICIYLLEGLSDEARVRAEQCSPGEIVTSAIAYAEVMRGLDPSNERGTADVGAFFRIVEVVAFDGAAATRYSDVPFKRGRFDRLIAAHALALGLTLVTNNERDFGDVPDLAIENWTLPL